ncbi:MAG: TonB-dependent receptor [Sphingomonadales bacterium]|nr:TonB-dependent receptor [Sphingomonadales bacterium]MBK9004061.1 TonB-dependent receptor [Sphingomonadales bacterium]MBK9269236.1 TonB-dependent receptor [Sphingomonadales bacterium]MBP6434105.1 TonB-dependent receptor [Sphingorhabdus sp.]
MRFAAGTATSLLALSFAASPAIAQQQTDADAADDDFHRTGEIVVTAPYFERLDLLAGTSALSGEDLAQQSRGQIGDTLLSLPGVSATSFTPGSSRPVLRGFQGNRVAVLTDGIGNIDASNTSADHAVTIESLTTERIEVLRGPAVLLFGGQAVGGAVNAIDKRIPRAVPKEAIHVDALAGYGSAADEWSGGASVDLPLAARFVIHADGSYRKSDDLRIGGFQIASVSRAEVLELADDEESEGHPEDADKLREAANNRGRVPNSAVETWTAGVGTAFIDDGGNLGVSFSIYDTKYGIPGRPGVGHHHEAGAPVADEEAVTIGLRQYRADLRGEVETGGGFLEKLTFRAGYADYQHTEFEGDEVGTIFKSQGFEGRAEAVQANRNGWRGASGIQYMSRDFEATGAEAFVPPNRTRQLGLFTLQEFDLGGVHLEAALRYDRASQEAQTLGINRSFNNVSAAFGAAYLVGDLKIGINASRTGRAPSVEELFSDGPHIATQAYEVGDPTLRSEKAWNAELYARFDSTNLDATLTVYSNWFDGFIYEDSTGAEEDDLPVFQYFQSDARFWGVEADVSARLGHVDGFDVVIDGVADYTRASISDGGGPVPRIPPLRLLGGLELQSGSLDLRGEVEWTDGQRRNAAFETETAGFTLVNASANWRPFGRNRNISLIASANNLFDVTARRAASFTKDYVPLSGRDFRLTARFSF